MNPVRYRVADVIDIEVEEADFWPKNHDARNQCVVGVPFAV